MQYRSKTDHAVQTADGLHKICTYIFHIYKDVGLQRCRACVGELRRGTFGKLLEMLVESVVMYGAEVWGCCRQLGEVEQVQLRAMRIFLGVGRLHPKVSLLVEMGVLPLEWVAKLKCVEFWYRVRKLGDESW